MIKTPSQGPACKSEYQERKRGVDRKEEKRKKGREGKGNKEEEKRRTAKEKALNLIHSSIIPSFLRPP